MPKNAPTIGKREGTTAKPTATRGLSRNALLLIGAGAVLVFALVLIIQQSSLRSATPVSAIKEGAASIKGSEGAKVVVTVYSDFQCPHCKTFQTDIEPKLMADFVNTNKIRLDYKHYIVISDQSSVAGNASECAAEQGYFWSYHDILFAQQGLYGADTFSLSRLKEYAREISGFNTSQFNTCVDNQKYVELVYRDMQEGSDAGVSGTPTVFVNGQKVANGQDYNQLKAAIDAALQAAS